MEIKNLQGLMTVNTLGRCANSLKDRYWVDPQSKHLACIRRVEWDTPWDQVVPDPDRHCKYFQMIFGNLGFIPTFCLNCWKVVVRPQSLRQLFALRDLMLEKGKFSKCGTEERDWTPGAVYGGYFYTNSRGDGERRYLQVRSWVDERLSPDVPVILKRYCTEFEINKGDSRGYVQPKNAKHAEDAFYRAFNLDFKNTGQPDFVKFAIYERWIKYGWRWGTAQDRKEIEEDWNNGEPLYTLPRTYHQEIQGVVA